ncbi:hypothetical protein BD408DRAFT_349464, partial [Parasitella parasitica]
SNQPSIIPGLIPLIPLNPQLYQESQQNGQEGSRVPIDLSDEDLHILSTTTREGLEQRLRILSSVDEQIADSIIRLTRVLSVMPAEKTKINSQSSQNLSNDASTGLPSHQQHANDDSDNVSQNQATGSTSMAAELNDNDSQATKVQGSEEQNEKKHSISDRKREKMPDYTASSTE